MAKLVKNSVLNMTANKSCIWNNDCSLQNLKGCPLEDEEYMPGYPYKQMCDSHILKSDISSCPPHAWEEYVLFNVFRYKCKHCMEEK